MEVEMWGHDGNSIFDILEPIRESGDGDSGTEEKKCEILLDGLEKENVDFESVKEALGKLAEEKKDLKQSKIPIRRKNGSNDFGDIFKDLELELVPCESETNQDSLSPEVSLASEELTETILEELCETILEAPEGFRCSSPHTKDPVFRDIDNGERAETGDTCGRASEEDEGGAPGEAPDVPLREVIGAEDNGNNENNVGTCMPAATPVNNLDEAGRTFGGSSPGQDMIDDDGYAGVRVPATVTPSIGSGVAQFAQASRCSRDSAVQVCGASDDDRLINSCEEDLGVHCDVSDEIGDDARESLRWEFRNGRLVFEVESESGVGQSSRESEDEENPILNSKNLNRRLDLNSRLKLLEQKLKDAGLTDSATTTTTTQVVDKDKGQVAYDANENEISWEEEGSYQETTCEFDVRKVGAFAGFDADDYYVVYDELEEEELGVIDRCEMRGDGADVDRVRHNPDHDNLKSLLKKPGREERRKKNKVVFNENKNEFFDADYIILIREDCDYDEDDDDGVCCCNQHEMVRLTCCEPNCNCNYDGYQEQTPQSPKFAPPLEFVDAVTLSPPEGYKDMELGEQQLMALQQMSRRAQRTAVCRECSATHDEDDGSLSDNEERFQANDEEAGEKEKTDQSQQTTPTTPPPETENPDGHKYVLESVTMTTVKEQQRLVRDEERKQQQQMASNQGGSHIAGILKGGRLWKQQGSLETNGGKTAEIQQNFESSSVTSDDESSNRRSVRFIEAAGEDDKRDVCDGAADDTVEETCRPTTDSSKEQTNSISPESTEMLLTFKLGNHVLISNNSLKPNSAVRQLFPCTKPLSKGGEEEVHQYLVTAESLKAFEEAKRAKLPQIIQSGETDESIKRAIERNTLRRSLIRYEPKSKKKEQKQADNSLVERIKQLTCDVDVVGQNDTERRSPPGEEARNSPDVGKHHDKSFSPSSSSTTSSSSSSVSSTYRKITDLFAKKEKPDIQNNVAPCETSKVVHSGPAPDLGNGAIPQAQEFHDLQNASKGNQTSAEARKQFLSSLAPLTACVSGVATPGEYYHPVTGNYPGDRMSVASSVGNEYSLEDIDEGLKEEEESKKIAPDVLAGTPSASESGDELALFVQQDAGRIERIKKKYQQETNNEDDDDHDDYGFNRRPSVRGIKPKFGTTTEILQQIQNQLQPPTAPRPNNHSWPYYSESGFDNNAKRNINQNAAYQQQQLPNVAVDDLKSRNFIQPQFRPMGLMEENIYQNCANQRCNREVVYRANVNHVYTPVVRVGTSCNYYQSLPRNRNGRPLSPPPLDVSKNFHQTMVYIPYNHIEGYQPASISPNTYYTNDSCYSRVSNQNLINKRYIDPIYVEEQRYQGNVQIPPKQMVRVSYTTQQAHIINSRSESPLPGQFSTARSTQTPSATMSTCSYYPTVPRYRSMVGPPWQCGDPLYASKMNRHSFPAATVGPRYPMDSTVGSGDTDSQHSLPLPPNGLRHTMDIPYSSAPKDTIPNSPTKPRYIERGAPEGAASISPQDAAAQSTTGTMTSPTSPPQQVHQGTAAPKPLFYAMNV